MHLSYAIPSSTNQDIGLENLAEEKQYSTDMEMAEIESDRQNLDEICAATGGDQEHLMKVAAGLLGEEAGVKGQPNIGSFALNAVVVLAKEALKRNGEQHHSKVLQDTLEKMHLQYTSLANECTCLQDKLKNEKVKGLCVRMTLCFAPDKMVFFCFPSSLNPHSCPSISFLRRPAAFLRKMSSAFTAVSHSCKVRTSSSRVRSRTWKRRSSAKSVTR